MILITPETKLSDIVTGDPNVITVLNKFDIRLGVGDKTVGSECKEKNLEAEFFVTILNTFLNKDYFPEKLLPSFNASKTVNYLRKTNCYYQQFQIPNIERHFNLLISKSENGNNNLELLRKFFFELKDELLKRIENDTNVLFPEILNVSNSTKEECIKEISFPLEEEDSIEEKLSDLKNMFVIHLSGDYDVNLCHAVLFAILSLEKDIQQNNRIRSRLLIPYIKSLKK